MASAAYTDRIITPSEIRAVMSSFAGRPRTSVAVAEPLRHASVCLLLMGNDDPKILMIERAANLRLHPGQWGLPGGKQDAGETTIAAALRELGEELGLLLDQDAVIGQLDGFVTRSGFLISPVVCHCPDDLPLSPNPSEVANIFSLRLSELVQPDRFEHFEVTETSKVSVRMHVNGGYLYAPASAILYQFRELLMGRFVSVEHYEQPIFAWA